MRDPIAIDEHARLAALRSLDILDTSSEEAFDRLTRLAADAIGAPAAAFTLVDDARVWLKSRFGTDAIENDRDDAFCTHTITGDDVFVVEDARLDPRFNASKLVIEDGVRFYAGAPVTLTSGEVVGAVCTFDTMPHARPDAVSLALMKGLALAAGHLLDLRRELQARRRAELKLREHAHLLELAEEMAGIGTWRLDFATGRLEQSPGINSVYGLEADLKTPSVDALLAMYEPADRKRIIAMLDRARESGRGYSFDATLRRASDGSVRSVRVKASVEKDGEGRPIRLIGVLRDVSIEKKAFELLNAERLEANRRARHMSHLASTDALTGLPNRRAFTARIEAALASAATTTLVVLDLDHFKTINDQHGHDVGDEALAAFGRICSLLHDDGPCYAGRIGGEEFAFLMRYTNKRAALERLDLLRRICSSQPITTRDGLKLHLRFSAGIAQSADGDDVRSFFQRADQALYRAKRDGRDRTALAA